MGWEHLFSDLLKNTTEYNVIIVVFPPCDSILIFPELNSFLFALELYNVNCSQLLTVVSPKKCIIFIQLVLVYPLK